MPRKARTKPMRNVKKSKNTQTYFCGLDLSLTGTGIVVVSNLGVIHFKKTLKNKLKGEARLAFIRDEILEVMQKYNPKATCIEDYSYAATIGVAYSGELGGVVKLALAEGDYKFHTAPPTRLKKFIVGGGRAEKDMIILHVYKRFGFEADDNNQADACGLAMLARCMNNRSAFMELLKPQQEVVLDMLKPPAPKKKRKKKGG